MSRRMSCTMTIDAVRDRTKTVTRRKVDSWKTLKPGDRLTLIEKGMGPEHVLDQVPDHWKRSHRGRTGHGIVRLIPFEQLGLDITVTYDDTGHPAHLDHLAASGTLAALRPPPPEHRQAALDI